MEEDIDKLYTLSYLKKRSRVDGDESEEVKRIESLPGGSLKPVKKTQ